MYWSQAHQANRTKISKRWKKKKKPPTHKKTNHIEQRAIHPEQRQREREKKKEKKVVGLRWRETSDRARAGLLMSRETGTRSSRISSSLFLLEIEKRVWSYHSAPESYLYLLPSAGALSLWALLTLTAAPRRRHRAGRSPSFLGDESKLRKSARFFRARVLDFFKWWTDWNRGFGLQSSYQNCSYLLCLKIFF